MKMFPGVLELIGSFGPSIVATFVVGALLWMLGVRDGFILSAVALLIGGVPLFVLEWREMRRGRFTLRKRQRKSRRAIESTHPAER